MKSVPSIVLLSILMTCFLIGQNVPDGYKLSPHVGKTGKLEGFKLQVTDTAKKLPVERFLRKIERIYPLGKYIRSEYGIVMHGEYESERIYTNAILYLIAKFENGNDEPIVFEGFISPLSRLTCQNATIKVIPATNEDHSQIELTDSYHLICDGKEFWMRVEDKRVFETGHYNILQTSDGIVVIIPSN